MPQVVSRTLRLAAAFLVVAGLVPAALPALAQAPETASPRVVYGDGVRAPAIMVDPETSRTPGMVDESALRYYASQKQTARMRAEIARLKRLYPGWTEPPDLDSLQPSPPEEAPLWDLFTAGRLQDLRAAINARRSVEPSWQPSEELGRKLRRAEFRSSIAAAAGKNPEEVVALYRADPSALDPADVESIWTIADDLAATGAGEDAFNLYKSVLDGNADTGARLATIQKAMAHIKMEQAERLIAMGRQDSSGLSEFEPIRLDITRARIAAFLHDEPAQTPTLPDLTAFQAYARKTAEPSQTGLLGWYAYKRRQFREALEWFKMAIARGGDAMVAHGLAHTLRELNMMREAEEVAYAWRERFVGNELLFIDLLERKLTLASPPYIEPARIERYARVVNATGSGEGAQGLAWYAYNSCQFDAALEWFQRATAWMPSESTVFGYALTLQRLRRQRPYLEVVNRYDGLFPKVVDLLFRESQGGPPLPCAVQGATASTGRAAPAAANAVRPEPQVSYGRVPRPDAPGAGGRTEAVPPAVQRGEFPLAVPLDNPLRYPAAGTGQAPAGAYAREPVVPAPPLVARRVPGAGAMPYERYGYTLLPGYNGLDKPEGMAGPPPGTLWQDQQGERTRSAAPESVRFSVPARTTSERAVPAEKGFP
jgi:tetratricopeptide (TPR) repeat protein